MEFTITIVGLGLMGGSMAKALRGWRNAVIAGVDKDTDVVSQSLADGTVDRCYLAGEPNSAEALSANVVIIALHPLAALEFIKNNGRHARAGSLWTDIVGVKKAVMEHAQEFIAEGVDFIGGHPMAGLEKFGYGNSVKTLFQGCNYVIVRPDGASDGSLELIRDMVFYIGASRITFSEALHHDTMIGYVSQMPHVLAPAIIASVNYLESKGFEGGSFHDLTRVGTLDPRLWSELFLLNREPLSRTLKELEDITAELRGIIERGDGGALYDALAGNAARKDAWFSARPQSEVLERDTDWI